MLRNEQLVNVVEITTHIKPEPFTCPYCGGLGYVEADVGQLYECNPCKTTGFLPLVEENVYHDRRK